jgi:hypothetical protein
MDQAREELVAKLAGSLKCDPALLHDFLGKLPKTPKVTLSELLSLMTVMNVTEEEHGEHDEHKQVQEEIIGQLADLVKCDPKILRDFPIGFPNIPMPTFGGVLFWDDVAEIKGWRMQENIFTGHWRLLDPRNMRYAWGKRSKIVDIFIKAARKGEEDEETSTDQEENTEESNVISNTPPLDEKDDPGA